MIVALASVEFDVGTMASSGMFVAAAPHATASEAELLARIEKLAAELEQLKAELKASKRQTAAVEQRSQAPAVAPAPATATPTRDRVGDGRCADGADRLRRAEL
jgi:hypothetical protein